MKTKKTQKDRVVTKLLKDGFITRNECLRNFISRLSAIIQDLELEGWEFETSRKGNSATAEGDYVYKVIKSPFKKIVYTLENGEQVTNYKK